MDDENRLAALQHWASVFGNPALTWDDLGFLREHWSGPIALKGILHPDDARRAAERVASVAALILSGFAAVWTWLLALRPRRGDGCSAACFSDCPVGRSTRVRSLTVEAGRL